MGFSDYWTHEKNLRHDGNGIPPYRIYLDNSLRHPRHQVSPYGAYSRLHCSLAPEWRKWRSAGPSIEVRVEDCSRAPEFIPQDPAIAVFVELLEAGRQWHGQTDGCNTEIATSTI